MPKSKDWKNVSASFLLKLDPFYNNNNENFDVFIPIEKVFFNRLYIEPVPLPEVKEINNNIHKKILNASENLIICIKGYAGCGKSVYVQKIIYDLYPKEFNFEKNAVDFGKLAYNLNDSKSIIHKLEEGSGSSSDDILFKYIDDVSLMMANDIKNIEGSFDLFKQMVNSNDEAIKHIDVALKIHDNFLNNKAIKKCLNFTENNIIRETFRRELKKYQLPLIFAIDCLWRISVYNKLLKSDKKINNKSLFIICFDNLDAIDNIDKVTEFISKLCNFKQGLDSCYGQLKRDNKDMKLPYFSFFVTCRNITWGRMHLSEYAEDKVSTNGEYYCDFDISNFYNYVDIVKKRLEYFEKISNKKDYANKVISEIKLINKLNSLKYVQERFKPLFNYNYRKCIEVIDKIKNNIYMDEAIQMIESNYSGKDNVSVDGVYSGSSSIFFRLVFDYFKEKNLFNKNRLGLVDLSLDNNDVNDNNDIIIKNYHLTSQTRVILTYLYNQSKKNNGRMHLNEVFEYFEGIYNLEDVCHSINCLLTRTEAWRRPIYFSSHPLNHNDSIESLLNELDTYKREKERATKSKYLKLEVCKAGEEYIEFVISHFEFFSCRLSDSLMELPPLFSNKSLEFNIDKNEYMFETTCKIVKRAVQKCCDNLLEFNENVRRAKKQTKEEYLSGALNKKTGHEKPQLHEERVIFYHIFHIESYRRYILDFKSDEMGFTNEKKIELNKRLVTIIEDYLVLHNNKIEDLQRRWIEKSMLKKVNMIKQSAYTDFKTIIESDIKDKE